MVQTIEQKLTEGLINNGLYKEQATQVMENLKNDEMKEIMKGRWSDTIDNYPQAMINLLWAQAKHKAVEWDR